MEREEVTGGEGEEVAEEVVGGGRRGGMNAFSPISSKFGGDMTYVCVRGGEVGGGAEVMENGTD